MSPMNTKRGCKAKVIIKSITETVTLIDILPIVSEHDIWVVKYDTGGFDLIEDTQIIKLIKE
jgi:hypothetical protein